MDSGVDEEDSLIGGCPLTRARRGRCCLRRRGRSSALFRRSLWMFVLCEMCVDRSNARLMEYLGLGTT